MGISLDRATMISVAKMFAAATASAAANRLTSAESRKLRAGLGPRLAIALAAVLAGNLVGDRVGKQLTGRR